MSEIHEHHLIVRDEEIDPQGHANNVVYVQWMQDAAVAHSASLGWPGRRYLDLGAGWVVRWHKIEYHAPALAGDRVVVRTWVATMNKVTSLRRYRVLRLPDETLLATAETLWAFISYATARPTRIPPEIAGAFPLLPPLEAS